LRERKNRTRVQVARTTVREDAPLERKASGPLLDELLRMELDIRRRYEAHLAARNAPSAAAETPATPEKARIVRALRQLKG